jgi:hypothetical protein
MMAQRMIGGMITVAVIVAQPVMAQDHGAMPDVSGEWELTAGQCGGELELTVEEHEISGFMTLHGHGRFAVRSAEFDGHELRFEVSLEGMTLVFSGTIDGDEYIGEITEPPEMSVSPFVAKRRSP